MHREHTAVSSFAVIVATAAELPAELGFVDAFFPGRAQLLGAYRDAGVLAHRAGLRRSARAAPMPPPPPSLIDEIVFYVATDESVREAFLAAGGAGAKPAPCGKKTAARATKRAGTSDPRAALREALARE